MPTAKQRNTPRPAIPHSPVKDSVELHIHMDVSLSSMLTHAMLLSQVNEWDENEHDLNKLFGNNSTGDFSYAFV